MNTTNVTVNDQNYSVGKLNALTQFHVMRRLAPMMGAVSSAFQLDDIKQGLQGGDPLKFLMPIVDQLALMPDEEANYIIFTCLGVVRRQTPTGEYTALLAPGSQSLMFEDVDMSSMIRLVVEVLKWNLSGFFGGLGEVTASPSS